MDASPADIAAAFLSASTLARQGEFDRAERLCEDILRVQFDHGRTLLLRGVIELQTGREERAVASFQASLRTQPPQPAAQALLGDALLQLKQPQAALSAYEAALSLRSQFAPAHFGRGNALLDLGRPLEAAASYEAALRLQPNHAESWFNRGNSLLSARQDDAAVDSFDRAIALRPAYMAAHNNRGTALLSLHKCEEALAAFDTALAFEPGFVDAWINRGSTLRESRRPREALTAFEQALQLRPDCAEARYGLGVALRDLRRPLEAMASFEHALRLQSGYVQAHCGLGDALLDLHRPEEALTAHERALGLMPASADALIGCGNSLCALRRFAEAMACYDEALRLDPSNAYAHHNRGNALLEGSGLAGEAVSSFERATQIKPAFALSWRRHADALLALQQRDAAVESLARTLQLDPDFDFAAGALLHAQQCSADWSVRLPAASRQQVTDAVLAGRCADLPFSFLSVSDSAAAQRQCARTYGAHRCPPATPRWNGERYRHERIRVAYLSGDFRAHAVSYLLAGVFEQHDPGRFETIAVSFRPEESTAFGQRVKAAFSRFIDVSGRSDLQVASLLRSLEIDIAVDLTGFTAGLRPRILAHRPAPIQVNYLGFPGTLGVPYMDYILADDFVIPKDRAQHYAEQIVYLPNSFQANDGRRVISEQPVTRAAVGLPDDAFVFCCFNNTYKLNPMMFDLWMRLLDRVPGAVLWLLSAGETACTNLKREAALRGIADHRLVFAPRVPYAEHLGRLGMADLFLDTLPFNGGTTASDALWAGLPLLTCAGEAFAARMAGSLLHAAGLSELVTSGLDRYEATALRLAQQPGELQALRRRLHRNRGWAPLFDTDRFRRNLERAYEHMWQRHERGDEPAAFCIRE